MGLTIFDNGNILQVRIKGRENNKQVIIIINN